MNNPVITTTNLTKVYGTHRVLDAVNLTIPAGAIYGFIGANGAGKTTTIRILLGLISATSGTATVLGHQRGKLPCAPIDGIAYLPDVPQGNSWLTAKDTLITFAKLSGITANTAALRADSLLELVGLGSARSKVGGFSRGMKQRLGIALALVGSPKLLILDEPTSALDPMGRVDVLNIISSLQGKATVLFSSHLLVDVQQVCTHVGLLDRGKLLAQGSLDDVLASVPTATTSLQLRGSTTQIEHAQHVLANAVPDIDVIRETATLQDVYTQLTHQNHS